MLDLECNCIVIWHLLEAFSRVFERLVGPEHERFSGRLDRAMGEENTSLLLGLGDPLLGCLVLHSHMELLRRNFSLLSRGLVSENVSADPRL